MANATVTNSTCSKNFGKPYNSDYSIFSYATGFGILAVILVCVILCSAYLCISVKKDSGNLWPIESAEQNEIEFQVAQHDEEEDEKVISKIVSL